MRWITEHESFERIALSADGFIRSEESGRAAHATRMLFDSTELCTRPFFGLLRNLMAWSGDTSCYYLVINPHPERYFRRYFGKYPLLEIFANDPVEDYLAALNQDPDGSPADAVGTNWSEYVILPPSEVWFIRAIRDDLTNQRGHLWVPHAWRSKVRDSYPYVIVEEM